jgi:TRAP-type C4-dicarboxylate transport system permease small subunit
MLAKDGRYKIIGSLLEGEMVRFKALLDKTDSVLLTANTALLFVCGGVLTSIFTMVTLDVFMRFLFNKPLPASLSISELLVGWVIFIPLAYTLLTGGHVRVSIISLKLPHRLQVLADAFVFFADFVFFGLLTYWAWLHFWESYVENEVMWAAIKLPWWVGKMSMFFGMLFIALTSLHLLIVKLNEFCQEHQPQK